MRRNRNNEPDVGSNTNEALVMSNIKKAAKNAGHAKIDGTNISGANNLAFSIP